MKTVREKLISDIRDWADNPAANGMVPVSPVTLRRIADMLAADSNSDSIFSNETQACLRENRRLSDAFKDSIERFKKGGLK